MTSPIPLQVAIAVLDIEFMRGQLPALISGLLMVGPCRLNPINPSFLNSLPRLTSLVLPLYRPYIVPISSLYRHFIVTLSSLYRPYIVTISSLYRHYYNLTNLTYYGFSNFITSPSTMTSLTSLLAPLL